MTRLFTRLASAAAAAAFAGVPAWAQTPVPTSPTDPLARIHGWVEAAPGSQAAKPEPETPAAKQAPQPEAARALPETMVSKPIPESPTANVAPPAKATPEAAPVANAKPAPEPGDAAAPGRTRPAHSARHVRAAEQPSQHREEADRRPRPGDRTADQLNRQELNKLNTARGAAPARSN